MSDWFPSGALWGFWTSVLSVSGEVLGMDNGRDKLLKAFCPSVGSKNLFPLPR